MGKTKTSHLIQAVSAFPLVELAYPRQLSTQSACFLNIIKSLMKSDILEEHISKYPNYGFGSSAPSSPLNTDWPIPRGERDVTAKDEMVITS